MGLFHVPAFEWSLQSVSEGAGRRVCCGREGILYSSSTRLSKPPCARSTHPEQRSRPLISSLSLRGERTHLIREKKKDQNQNFASDRSWEKTSPLLAPSIWVLPMVKWSRLGSESQRKETCLAFRGNAASNGAFR